MTAFAQISLWGDECVVHLSRRGLRMSLRGKRGRPATRPHGTVQTEWTQYLRYRRKASNRAGVTVLDFESWKTSTDKFRDRGRRGGLANREKDRQVIEWVVIVPRRDLIKDPALEQDWHKRLYYSPELAKTHRVHLRGVQKRVVR